MIDISIYALSHLFYLQDWQIRRRIFEEGIDMDKNICSLLENLIDDLQGVTFSENGGQNKNSCSR